MKMMKQQKPLTGPTPWFVSVVKLKLAHPGACLHAPEIFLERVRGDTNPGEGINFSNIILHANLVDDYTKQINHLLLNNPDLFNFLSRSPMLSIFNQGKALSAFA